MKRLPKSLISLLVAIILGAVVGLWIRQRNGQTLVHADTRPHTGFTLELARPLTAPVILTVKDATGLQEVARVNLSKGTSRQDLATPAGSYVVYLVSSDKTILPPEPMHVTVMDGALSRLVIELGLGRNGK